MSIVKTKSNTQSIPTMPVDNQVLATNKPSYSPFTNMALESSDYCFKLPAIHPTIFFSEEIDEKGRIKLDIMADFGFYNLTGIRIRQWSGELQLADGSMIPNFSVIFKGQIISPEKRMIKLMLLKEDFQNCESIKDSFVNAGMLQVYRFASEVWKIYCSGKYSRIDHSQTGIKRLTRTELDTKIQNLLLAKSRRNGFLDGTAVKASIAQTQQALSLE